jgi:hypothetical protein
MDEQLKQLLVDLLASEDDAGCSSDLTVVAAAPLRKLRDYVRVRAIQTPVATNTRNHHWHIEVTLDRLVHLTLTQRTTALVASALEIVNPDCDRKTRNARDLALGLQNACEDAEVQTAESEPSLSIANNG